MMLNTTTEQKVSFAFALNALCHEMIHYYDTVYGDILYKSLLAFREENKDFDEHDSKVFMDKMNEFNKLGMTIIPDDGSYPLSDLNQLSIFRNRKMMEEMESDILSGKHRKKTSILDKISVIDGKLGAIAF